MFEPSQTAPFSATGLPRKDLGKGMGNDACLTHRFIIIHAHVSIRHEHLHIKLKIYAGICRKN